VHNVYSQITIISNRETIKETVYLNFAANYGIISGKYRRIEKREKDDQRSTSR